MAVLKQPVELSGSRSAALLAPAYSELNLLGDWLLQTALPFWSTRGVDARNGYFERFSSSGTVMPDARRARLIGRQMYCFAAAKPLGWDGAAEDLVQHGVSALERGFFAPDGTVIRTTDDRGTPLDTSFDLYDQAFALFGMAAAHRALGRPKTISERATALLAALRARYAHPVAGFEEAFPPSSPLKANPHMHLFEAALAWSDETADDEWAGLADMIAELCLSRFLSPSTGALSEFYDRDWRAIASPPDDMIEPGHQFEWAWLLIRWGRRRNRPDAIAAARRLIDLAETYGVDAETGLAINALSPDLTPRDRLARLWPQTERIKAHVAAFALAAGPHEQQRCAAKIAAAAEGLRRYFDHPVPGLWYEHITPDGRPLDEPARASSLYHIMCAIHVMAEGLIVGDRHG